MNAIVIYIMLLWSLGAFGWLGRQWRRAVAARREAAELSHRRAVELALARRGQPVQAGGDVTGIVSAGDRTVNIQGALPAAVIAAPPGARPVRGVPGDCRHEQIVPVIGDDGELKRWVCKNWPRCDAEFDKSVALYEPSEMS